MNKKKYNMGTIFLLLFFLCSAAIMIFYRSYYFGCHISPDSSNYLLAAETILDGNGFWYQKHAGLNSYFDMFPMGYPLAIAWIAKITGTEIYLASKILSVVILFFILLFLLYFFGRKASVCSLFIFNVGFNIIFFYTWSEQLYLLGEICFTGILSKIWMEQPSKWKEYILLFLSSCMMFFSRYIGLVSVIVIGAFILYGNHIGKEKNMLRKLLYVDIANILLMGSYLFHNKVHTGNFSGVRNKASETFLELFMQLYRAIKLEISNFFGYFAQLETGIVLVILLALVICYVKNFSKEDTRSNIFCFSGISYFLCFMGMKSISHMDEISFRFLIPASVLLYIGICEKSKNMEKISKNRLWIAAVVFVICVNYLSTPVLAMRSRGAAMEKGYIAQKNYWIQRLDNVEPLSVVFWAFDNETEYNMVKYLRNDVIFEWPYDLDHALRLKEQYQNRTIYIDEDGLIKYAEINQWDTYAVSEFVREQAENGEMICITR